MIPPPMASKITRKEVVMLLGALLAVHAIVLKRMLGQDSILLLLCYGLAWVALVKKSDFAAGAWLALGLCKYHLVLPFVLRFVLERRARRAKVIAGSLTGTGNCQLSTVSIEFGAKRPAAMEREKPNLHGFFVTTLGNSRLVQVLVLAASLLLVAVAWYGGRNTGSAHTLPGELSFARNLVMTLLVSYHAYVQDLSLLFFVLLLALDVLIARPALPRLVHRILLVCVSILLFSPIYLVLIVRFGKLVLFFFALVRAIAWLRRTGPRTTDVVTPAAC
jgi:hypothetical protein